MYIYSWRPLSLKNEIKNSVRKTITSYSLPVWKINWYSQIKQKRVSSKRHFDSPSKERKKDKRKKSNSKRTQQVHYTLKPKIPLEFQREREFHKLPNFHRILSHRPFVIKLALSSTRSSLSLFSFFNLLAITPPATQPGNFKTNISSGSFRNFRWCRRLIRARVAQFLCGTLMKGVLPLMGR